MSASDSADSEWYKSWEQSLSQTCRSRTTLSATPKQVLEFTNGKINDNPDLILFSLPTKQNVVEWNSPNRSEAVCKPPPATAAATSTPTKAKPDDTTIGTPAPKKGLFSYVAETVLSPLLGTLTPAPQPDYDMGDEQDDARRPWTSPCPEEDDAYQATTETSQTYNSGLVGWDAKILDTELAQECLKVLEAALSSHQTCSDSLFPKIIRKRRPSENENVNTDCWAEWIKTSTAENCFVARLSDPSDMDFLLECLSKKEKLSVISMEGKDDLVVLAPLLEVENTETYHQVLVSWWELTNAQKSLEDRREQWSKQAEDYKRQAIKEKQQQRKLNLFKLHKKFVKRLDDSGGQLLNLEKIVLALEESWHQRHVVKALETSTKTLQTLRQNANTWDEVGDLMDNLREEIDNVADVQKEISENDKGFDEEDLRKELEGLMLEDSNEKENSKQGSQDFSGGTDKTKNTGASQQKSVIKINADQTSVPPGTDVAPEQKPVSSERVMVAE